MKTKVKALKDLLNQFDDDTNLYFCVCDNHNVKESEFASASVVGGELCITVSVNSVIATTELTRIKEALIEINNSVYPIDYSTLTTVMNKLDEVIKDIELITPKGVNT